MASTRDVLEMLRTLEKRAQQWKLQSADDLRRRELERLVVFLFIYWQIPDDAKERSAPAIEAWVERMFGATL